MNGGLGGRGVEPVFYFPARLVAGMVSRQVLQIGRGAGVNLLALVPVSLVC